MDYFQIAKTNLKASRLALGCMRIPVFRSSHYIF